MSKSIGFVSHEEVKRLCQSYPQGTRLELIGMDDPYATLKAGDRATVTGVDDAGHIMCKWDAGSGLSLIPNVDSFRKLTTKEVIIEEVNKVRFHPNAPNMFDVKAAFNLAMELSCDTLCDFCFMDTHSYSSFILTGKLPDDYEIPKL